MAEPIDNVRFAMEGEVLALHPAPSNDMALNSIAISLKRIADAHDRLAAAFEYNPSSYNMLDAIKESKR